MRLAFAAAVALALAACSPGGDDRTSATGSTKPKTAEPAERVQIPVRALDQSRPKKFASRKELEWAAAWIEWHGQVDALVAMTERIVDNPTRRARAATPESRDHKRLQKALSAFRSCSDEALTRGAPPSTRLEPVAVETAAACERFDKAVARLETSGFEDGLPSEAVFAVDHLQSAAREARSFIPGLDEEIDDLPLVDHRSHGSRIQLRYTFVTSRLVRNQVTISCYSPADWRRKTAETNKPANAVAGFVRAHTASGNLSPVVCRWLDRLAYGHEAPTDLTAKAYLAQALVTLGHEAQHALGTRREAVAECYGMQRIAPLARALGASRSYARELAAFFWTRLYPYEPAGYGSDACRPGEKLDLQPRQPAWP